MPEVQQGLQQREDLFARQTKEGDRRTNPKSASLKVSGLGHLWDKGGSVVKNPPANARDLGLIPGWGRSPGEGNGNPLHYSCLGNPVDRGAWQATIQRIEKSQTRLSDEA